MTIQANFPSIRPTLSLDFANTEVLDPRITFSRPTTGTYYDAKTSSVAEQNLFIQSQAIGTTGWGLAGITATLNTSVAPDGTTTASTITASGGTSIRELSQSGLTATSSVGKTISVYAKAGTNNFIQFIYGGDGNAYANFDVSSGVLGTVGSNATATITSVGSGWYRCVMVTASTAVTSPSILLISSATAARAESNTLTTTVLLWGSQLEYRQTVTAYIATTTTAITNYIPVLQTAVANSARFDHDPVTRSSLGLLIEEQRTNLATYSEQFDNASWVKVDATVTANTIVAPDGNLTGDKLVEATTSVEHQINEPITLTTGTTYTFSVFAKAGERSVISLRGSGVWASDPRIRFTLTGSGTVTVDAGTPTGTITAIGNGWYRCTMTATTNASGASQFRMSLYNGTYGYTGDGYSGLFIWGAQLEAGAFATSYIPTVASQVTRSADRAEMTGTNFSSWYNQSQGTMYFNGTSNTPSSYGYPILYAISLGATGNNTVSLRNSATINAYLGATTLTTNITSRTNIKHAFAFQNNNAAAVYNGNTPVTSSSTSLISNSDTLGIGGLLGTSAFNGTIYKLSYYPIRLVDAQLQGLTG